jgi:hypothetical protein
VTALRERRCDRCARRLPPRAERLAAYARRGAAPRTWTLSRLADFVPVAHFHPLAMRVRRVALDWTLGDVQIRLRDAYDMRLSRDALRSWESGARAPTEAQVVALAGALGCEPHELAREPRVE